MTEAELFEQAAAMQAGASFALQRVAAVLANLGQEADADYLAATIFPGDVLPKWAQDVLRQRGVLHTSEEETP